MPDHAFLAAARAEFARYKKLSEDALAQLPDEAWFVQFDSESNSLAMIVKHLGCGLRSRWTDFLSSDGEKPDRDRDREFVIEPGDTKETLAARWEQGWRCLFAAVDSLALADLGRSVTIRGEPHSVPQAIERALAHAAYHAGQIVFLARHLAGPRWQSLSIPRGQSREFTARLRAKHGSPGREGRQIS
jgi:uncharacterized damage-inducible protein DinB